MERAPAPAVDVRTHIDGLAVWSGRQIVAVVDGTADAQVARRAALSALDMLAATLAKPRSAV